MESQAKAPRTAAFVKIEGKNLLQYWESEATRPQIKGASLEGRDALERLARTHLSRCLRHPFRSPAEIRDQQFGQLRRLVHLAYREIPFYADKYRAVGFHPENLRSWADFERVPVVTKDELMQAGLTKTVSSRWPIDDLFATRTFGTSGKTLLIRVNLDAILIDTLQGVRQFWLQSGLRFGPDDLTAMIYTVPWWFESVGDDFRSAFISGVIPPPGVARILDEMNPRT
jgi:phenylacetate-CoA ligase